MLPRADELLNAASLLQSSLLQFEVGRGAFAMGGVATHAGTHHLGQRGCFVGSTGNGFGCIFAALGESHGIGHALGFEEGTDFCEGIRGFFGVGLGGSAIGGATNGSTCTGEGLHEGLQGGFILGDGQTGKGRKSGEQNRYFAHGTEYITARGGLG